jgi:hypothetical protein
MTRRYRLREVMMVIAIVAVSLTVGGYLEGLRRDAKKARPPAVKANLASLPAQSKSDQVRYSTFFIGAFW